jgi:imidazole glycerol-phosphate synthase subunit HisH
MAFMITIVNYGVGNLSSIKNMLGRIGIAATLSTDVSEIYEADKIILPGVGAFDHCMRMFNGSGLRDIVTKKVMEEKVPVLGICVGLQMLGESSEEGAEQGLGWIKGRSIRFRQNLLDQLKIPHMGWTEVRPVKPSSLMQGYTEDPRFYFVHSFHLEIKDKKDELLTANYGYDFTAAIQRDNITGVQFHPEKSHKFGMKLLENFAKYPS